MGDIEGVAELIVKFPELWLGVTVAETGVDVTTTFPTFEPGDKLVLI